MYLILYCFVRQSQAMCSWKVTDLLAVLSFAAENITAKSLTCRVPESSLFPLCSMKIKVGTTIYSMRSIARVPRRACKQANALSM